MSLAKYKRDKITEALLDKGYQRHPELDLTLKFLWDKFYLEETEEIKAIIHNWIEFENDVILMESRKVNGKDIIWIPEKEDFIKLKRELADASNMIDFIFDRIVVLEEKLWELIR